MDELTKIAEALGLGAESSVEDIVAKIAAMVKAVQEAGNGAPPAGDEPPAEVAEMAAASMQLLRLTALPTLPAAITEIGLWRASHLALTSERAQLAQDRATLELSERRALVGELVTLGAEFPALAWATDKDGIPDGVTPAEEYASMKLDRLREKVAKQSAARGKTPKVGSGGGNAPRPPAGPANVFQVGTASVELTDDELAMCARKKLDPAKYAASPARLQLATKKAGG